MLTKFSALVLAVVLSGCGVGGDQPTGSRRIALSQTALHSRIAALAECPSPLNRLGIGRITPRLFVGSDGDVDFVIPAAEDAQGSAIRFDLSGSANDAGPIRVNWKIEISGTARELDLGEDRLLNPVKLAKELDTALDSYLSYYESVGSDATSQFSRKQDLAEACKKFGRAADAIAVATNPNLRRTIETQKSRDALGWLFRDNYKLRTSSPSSANWDEYGGGY